MCAVSFLFSVYENSIFKIFYDKYFTMPKIGHFIWIWVYFFELFIRCFNDFVEIDDFKLFVILFVFVLDKFVNFPQPFSQSWVKVVFYAIVCSWIKWCVPSFQSLCDHCPLIAEFIMQSVHKVIFFHCPLLFGDAIAALVFTS